MFGWLGCATYHLLLLLTTLKIFRSSVSGNNVLRCHRRRQQISLSGFLAGRFLTGQEIKAADPISIFNVGRMSADKRWSYKVSIFRGLHLYMVVRVLEYSGAPSGDQWQRL